MAPEMTSPGDLNSEVVDELRRVRQEFTRFLLGYQFAMQEVTTKLEILREEFAQLHQDNLIEHIASRMKSPERILDKASRRGVELTTDALRQHITDIAGIRVVCSFVADVYRLVDALTTQGDLEVLEVKDYIAHPKPNGYRSLHVILEVPVFLSSDTVHVPVEVQFRTVAMDFWASTEHKILYTYDGEVPADLRRRITGAAATAARLDEEMADLRQAIHGSRPATEQRVTNVSDAVLARLTRPERAADPAAERHGSDHPRTMDP